MRYFILLFTAIALNSCGPASEDRNIMHARAKKFQDSIANLIRTQMAEADPTATANVRPDKPATQETVQPLGE